MEKKLSVIVQSKGIEEATTALRALAKAASEVDKDVKGFLASQGKVVTENSKAALVSAKLQTELQKQAVLTQRLADAQQSAADRAASNAQKIIDKETKLAEAAQRRAEAEEKAAAKEAKAAQDKIQQMGRVQSQAEAMNRKIDEQRNKMDEVNKRGNVYVNTLRSMATAASAYLGVNFFASLFKEADAWGMMQSKLALATGSINGAKIAQEELFNMSQQLRVPLEEVTKLYTRMYIPLQRIGATSRDAMTVVGAFSTALKLAGATGQEASSAMLQFSQSLNAGRLNGGEFNSVAEAAPNVLRAIEAELIKTGRGAELAKSGLKKMATEGKLTTEVLVGALKSAAPKWRAEFESLPITVDGALTRIKNAWGKAIGEVGQDTKFNERMASALKSLETSLPAVAKTLGSILAVVAENIDLIIFGVKTLVTVGILKWVVDATLSFVEFNKTLGITKALITTLGFTPLGLALGAIATLLVGGAVLWSNYAKTVDEANKEAKKKAEETPNIVKAWKEENNAIERQIDLLREQRGEKAKYRGSQKDSSTEIRLEDLDKYKQVIAKVNLSRDEFNSAKKAWDEADKGNLSNSKLFREMQDKEMIYKEAVKSLKGANEERLREVRITGELEVETQRKNKDKYVATALEKFASTNEIAAKKRDEALADLEKYYKKETTKDQNYFKIKAGILREYQESLEKTKKTKESDLFDAQAGLYDEIMKARAEAAEKEVQSMKKRTDSMYEQNDAAKSNLEILLRQLESEDSLKESKAEQNVLEAERNLILLNSQGVMGLEIALANERLKIAQQTLDVTRQLDAAAEVKKQAEKYENAYQAANKKIEDGLYNAIGRGSEFGIKKLIQDVKSWFARLVLSPIIQPIAQFGASIMNPNAASASTNPMDVISNIGSAFSKLMNNGSTALADTIGKAGTFFGSEFMTSVSAAMKVGGTGFTGMAATALNAMPYVAAAVAAFDGMKAINKGYQIGNMSNDVQTAIFGIAPRLFGMQDKQMTGQTVTGNLGTDNLSRNVAWSQKGGLFRSDRSGTWSYNLGNSTAIQDGKAYQDTASMASDKALLTQLNSAYEALKSSTAGLAESLGLDASKIKERTDSISFTFGKTAEETSANINKMFETVGNTIADSLLGNLKELAAVGESSYQTISRLSTSISSVNNTMKMLQMAMFQTSVDGVKAANSLVNMFGGLDNFNQASAYFVENFLTEAELMAPMVEAVNKKMSDLGYSSVTTLEGFKNLVRSLDLTNQSQASLYAELLKLAPAFKQVADSAGTVGSTLDSYTAAVDAAKTTLESALRSVASSIQELSEKAIAAKQAEKEALNNISSGYFTAQDNVKAAQEKVIGLLRQSADAMKNFSTSIRDFVASLNGGTASGSYDALKARLNTTATLAQGGDVKSQQALTGLAQKFLEAAKSRSGSSSDYAREEARVKTLLLGVADTVDASVKAMALPEVVDPLKQANEELIAAQKSLLEYAALASTTGASTDRASQVTANSTSALLAAFMEAKANSAKAQSNLDIAQALTAQLNLPSLNEMSGFFAVLNEAYAANTALINAQAALSKSIEESVKKAGVSTEDFAKSLGLSGAEATAFTKMMSDAKLTTEGFKGLMEKTGLSASDLTIMLNSSGVSADKMALILANAGTDGEKFGDRLKAAGIPVDSFAEGLRLNGLKADSLGLIFDLSTTAAKTLEASLGNPATAATTLAGWLSTVSTTAEDLNKKFTTAGGDLKSLSKALEGTGFTASDLFGLLSIAGGSATSLDKLLKTGNAENINGTAVVKALGGTITTAGYLSDLLKVTEGDTVSAKKLADSIASSNTSLVNFYSIIAGAQTSASGFNELVETTGISAKGVLGVLGTDDDGLQGIAIASGKSLKSLIGLADQAGNTIGTLVKNLSDSGISAVSFEGIKSLTNSNASQLAGYINAASKSGETLSTDMDSLKLAANNFSSKLGLVAIPDLNSSVKESLNNFAKSIDLATGASDYVTGLLKSFTLPNAASTTTNAPTTVKSLNQQLVEDWYKTNANAIKSVDLEGIAYWTKEIEKYGVIAAKTAFAQSVAITTGTTALPINQFGSSVAPPPAPTTTSNDVLANKLTEVVSQLGLLREETKIGDLANVQATKAQTKLLNDVTDQGTALIVTSATI